MNTTPKHDIREKFQIGSLVFFKTAKLAPHKSSLEVKFQGHSYGMLLGYVPEHKQPPPLDHVLRTLGTAGFVKFDDIAEFIGEEQAKLVITKFEEKYYGPEAVAKAEKDVETPKVEKVSSILNAEGKPADAN